MTIWVVFTGKLSITREAAEAHAARYGLRVQKRVDSGTDYLVVGERPGNTKLEAAQRHNVRRINEAEFLALGAGQNPTKAVPVAPTKAAAKPAEAAKPAPRRRKKPVQERVPEWLERMRARAGVGF